MTRDQQVRAGSLPPSPRDVSAALESLVARSVLTGEQAGEVAAALAAAPGTPRVEGPSAAPPDRLAELAGYVGGALIGGAAPLFLATSWSGLGTAARVGTLAGLGAVLVVAGVAVCLGSTPAALRAGEAPARRRLVSTLWVLAAWSWGWAAHVWASATTAGPFANDHASDLTAGAVLLTASAVAYLLVPSILGQLSAWAGAVGTAGAAALLVADDVLRSVWFGVALVAVGVIWAVLALAAVVRERESALAAAVVAAVVGAQLTMTGRTHVLAYLLTAAVAVLCFVGYQLVGSWALLAGGMVATTVVVPEAADDLTGGSLPVVAVLLLTGVALLLACAVGLRVAKPKPKPATTDDKPHDLHDHEVRLEYEPPESGPSAIRE